MTTTKKCPACGNTHLALLRTLDKKVCTDCDVWIPWKLDNRQKPVGYEKEE